MFTLSHESLHQECRRVCGNARLTYFWGDFTLSDSTAFSSGKKEENICNRTVSLYGVSTAALGSTVQTVLQPGPAREWSTVLEQAVESVTIDVFVSRVSRLWLC